MSTKDIILKIFIKIIKTIIININQCINKL